MKKYRVTIKYGDLGKFKSGSQSVTVEAESDATAMRLAEAKFRSSNAAYRDKEIEVAKVEIV